MNKLIKGISVLNPVDVERDYYLYTVDYAIKHGYDHLQLIGPIHDFVKGNIDGMVFYRKYSDFNYEKDDSYVKLCMEVVNEACEKAKKHNIKNYMWHHELYLPDELKNKYPDMLNDYGDVEITHERVRDFLENKIIDFFDAYPFMDGIILTLHETSIPLLKLKNQKLGKVERVKYVTGILYDTCKSLGKELIVRNFASLEEDYVMMTKAYEEISTDMLIMDKWTQFDWSLTMPSNKFFEKIKKNPIFVEADIFGEFFGKGRLPLMLKKHIADKFSYCSQYNPAGYVARIDRNGEIPFGDVNEVNLNIMEAHLNGEDADVAIEAFFNEKYPGAGNEIREIMEDTEEILKKTIYLNGYLFSEMSLFPALNHCKNHYYFEMMRENYMIDSDEWFVPENFDRISTDYLIKEKEEAALCAEALFDKLELLKERIQPDEYKKLHTKFLNLKFVTRMWKLLALSFMKYVRCFELPSDISEKEFYSVLNEMKKLSDEGKRMLGDSFYCISGNKVKAEFVENYVSDITKSFVSEKKTFEEIKNDKELYDYIICAGGTEGHRLKKEVNFSDTLIVDGEICRVPGNSMGAKWSSVNAHGWFSYLLSLKEGKANKISVTVGSCDGNVDLNVTIGEKVYTIHENYQGKKDFLFDVTPLAGENSVRIRFDKISASMPLVYIIKVY